MNLNSTVTSCYSFNVIALNFYICEQIQHLIMSSFGSQNSSCASKHAITFIIYYLFVHLIKIIYQFMFKMACFYMPWI